MKTDFDDENDGCYYANVLKAFATIEECETYIENRRPFLPKNYSENRKREPIRELPNPANQYAVKTENFHPIQCGVIDLTNDSVSGFIFGFISIDENICSFLNIIFSFLL